MGHSWKELKNTKIHSKNLSIKKQRKGTKKFHNLNVVLEREERMDNSCKYSSTTKRCGSTDSDQKGPNRTHKEKSTSQ